MQRLTRHTAMLVTGLALCASVALAQYNAPFKGKSFKVGLMTAYEPCSTPDTTTEDTVQACSTLVRSDPVCGFDGGQGKIQLKMLTVGKVGFRVKILGLDAACEGQHLTFHATLRRTGDLCGGNTCQTVDVVDYEITSCIVQGRVCKSNGQALLPGGVPVNQTELFDIHVERSGLRTFNTGIVNNNSLS